MKWIKCRPFRTLQSVGMPCKPLQMVAGACYAMSHPRLCRQIAPGGLPRRTVRVCIGVLLITGPNPLRNNGVLAAPHRDRCTVTRCDYHGPRSMPIR